MFYCHKPFPKQLLIALAVQNISIIRNNVYVVSMFFSIGSFTTVALIPETNKYKQSSSANKRDTLGPVFLANKTMKKKHITNTRDILFK